MVAQAADGSKRDTALLCAYDHAPSRVEEKRIADFCPFPRFSSVALLLVAPSRHLPSTRFLLSRMASSELASTYAALILADEGLEITVSIPSSPPVG